MLPILYSKESAKADFFAHNGLGFIATATKCIVTEERNGAYELELEALPSDRLATEIVPLAYIQCLANPKDNPQIFEIYSVQRMTDKIIVNAQHIHYRLNGNTFSETYSTSTKKTPSALWADIQDFLVYPATDFVFSSDITTTGAPFAAANAPVSLGSFMLGTDGSILDTYGGEYHWKNYAVELLSARGEVSEESLRVGAGITNLDYNVDTNSLYTDISPYAVVPFKMTSGDYLGEICVRLPLVHTTESGAAEALPYGRALSYDFTEDFGKRYPSFAVESSNGASPTAESWASAQERLDTIVRRFIRNNLNSLITPKINLDITIQSGAKELKNLSLCDTIGVLYEPLNLETRAKVVKLSYDVIAEKTISIELSTTKKTLSRLITGANVGVL